MAYTITCTSTISTVSPSEVWSVWTDLEAYPQWDEREELNRMNGPFAVGTTGTFKQRGREAGTYVITAIEPDRSWTTETPLPGGKLVIEHLVEGGPSGVTLTKRYTAFGPMAHAFRWFFARGIHRAMPGVFTALETETGRRFARAKP